MTPEPHALDPALFGPDADTRDMVVVDLRAETGGGDPLDAIRGGIATDIGPALRRGNRAAKGNYGWREAKDRYDGERKNELPSTKPIGGAATSRWMDRRGGVALLRWLHA